MLTGPGVVGRVVDRLVALLILVDDQSSDVVGGGVVVVVDVVDRITRKILSSYKGARYSRNIKMPKSVGAETTLGLTLEMERMTSVITDAA